MKRVAFKMKLHPGCAAEYKRRHEALWPALEALLKEAGIEHYSIFLDSGSNDLFGCLQIGDSGLLDALAEQPVMKRWWDYMKDIMDTYADHAPVTQHLEEVFYLA